MDLIVILVIVFVVVLALAITIVVILKRRAAPANNSGPIAIVLTVPHATCVVPENHADRCKNHLCDYLAPEAADSFEQHLRNMNVEYTRINGEIFREVRDENRPQISGDSDMQKKIVKTIGDYKRNGYRPILLDVHSIPGACNMYDVPVDTDKLLLILDTTNNAFGFAHKLHKHMDGLTLIRNENFDKHYIVKLGVLSKTPSILLEFNERVHYENSKLSPTGPLMSLVTAKVLDFALNHYY
jgi:hypothetical protein